MDFEPYDEVKHGAPVRKGRNGMDWRAFFAALETGPQVLPKTRLNGLYGAAKDWRCRVTSSQLTDGQRIVVHLVEKL